MPKSMKTWQVEAIKNGRRPLPEEPGQRPWIPEKPEDAPCHPPGASLAQAIAAVRLLQSSPLHPVPDIANLHDQPAPKLATNGSKGSPWTDQEVALLVNLKRQNVGWVRIQVSFNPQ